MCLRRAMCISRGTNHKCLSYLGTAEFQTGLHENYLNRRKQCLAMPSTVLVPLGYSSLPNKCCDLRTITKEVSWYMITFISKLCMKKMESSKISVCFQECTHPYCFLMILLILPVQQKTVLAKLWDPRNFYFVHKSKQLHSLNSCDWTVSSAYRGEFSKSESSNLCENGMANLFQSTESLEPLCAAWWTSAMVHVTGNLQHGTRFKPLLNTKQSTRLFNWQNGSLVWLKKLISFKHFTFYLNTDFLYLESGEQECGFLLERKLVF